MRNEYQIDYENDLMRVKTELHEKTIRLRDISAATSNEDAVPYKRYLENRIAKLTKLEEQLGMICKLSS